MSRARTTLAAAGVVLALLATTACGGGGADPAPGPTSAASAKALAKPPRVGSCYRLTVTGAMQPSDASRPVPCSGPHTSKTILVGRIAPTAQGQPLAMDSARVQRQIANRCRGRVDAHVGGSTEAQRLSRVQAVWFSPGTAALAQGARWFRCDLVIGSTATTFANLPRRTRGLLARSGALDRYGTCGTAAPGSAHFARVLCAARHSWKARATITLPAGAHYLGKAVAKLADSQCRDVEARRAVNILRLRWSFEWPTQAQWTSGQRYGLCWTPDS